MVVMSAQGGAGIVQVGAGIVALTQVMSVLIGGDAMVLTPPVIFMRVIGFVP